MRPHNAGRTPSFVVVGLLIVTAILGFNYWNVSSKNSLLAREVNEARERFRVASVKKLAVEKRNDALMQKVSEGEAEINKQKSMLTRRDEELESINKQVDAKRDELSMHVTDKEQCRTELVRFNYIYFCKLLVYGWLVAGEVAPCSTSVISV